jgi:hypothetical protein
MPWSRLNSREPVDDGLVEVVAAEVVVARGRLDLEDAVADLEHGHVERAAAEVEDEDRLVGVLVEAVGQRAAVGSLMMRLTSRPAIWPASFVAWRWSSLKYAGTVMTARRRCRPGTPRRRP